jgi:hypothetical protein
MPAGTHPASSRRAASRHASSRRAASRRAQPGPPSVIMPHNCTSSLQVLQYTACTTGKAAAQSHCCCHQALPLSCICICTGGLLAAGHCYWQRCWWPGHGGACVAMPPQPWYTAACLASPAAHETPSPSKCLTTATLSTAGLATCWPRPPGSTMLPPGRTIGPRALPAQLACSSASHAAVHHMQQCITCPQHQRIRCTRCTRCTPPGPPGLATLDRAPSAPSAPSAPTAHTCEGAPRATTNSAAVTDDVQYTAQHTWNHTRRGLQEYIQPGSMAAARRGSTMPRCRPRQAVTPRPRSMGAASWP